MNRSILFDIDRTLFDTGCLIREIDQGILRVLEKTNRKKLDEASKEYMETLKRDREFEPEEFVKYISKKLKVKNPNSLVDVFYGKNNIYRSCLYPDTTFVLSELSKSNHLGIYSEGTLKFQTHKFNSMEIQKFIDKNLIFIFQEKDSIDSLRKLPKDAIVVDDKKIIVEKLFEFGISVIWINRKNKEVHPVIPTIFNLKQLLDSKLTKNAI